MTQDGKVMSSELRDDSRSGAGWEVVLKLDGEWLFGRRCADEGLARYVATATNKT